MAADTIVDHRRRGSAETVVLSARPEPVRVSPADTAVVVIDSAFAAIFTLLGI